MAVSGGGDSLALLLMANAWAARAGRRLIAASVDHGLQAAGADWAAWCARRAAALGIEHRTLVWAGDKPSAGLPAAARAARHALLADLARGEGAGVILMGHTADDVVEAAAMRAAGATTPDPRSWSPSPAWPQGRGVFLFRPLLGARRAALRDWLVQRGETWIEDPANADPRFARARARAALAASPPVGQPDANTQACAAVSALATPDGTLVLARDALTGAVRRGAVSLATAAVCAGGGVRAPRRDRAERLIERLATGETFTVSLAGARIDARNDRIVITRETGEYRRAGAAAQPLPVGEAVVWDGRFALTAHRSGLTARPLAGLMARLDPLESKALASLPAAARGALPAVMDKAGAVTCPILAQGPHVRWESLVEARFLAASGAVRDEETLWRVAKAARTS
ncbi:MAG: tRNA lysidine(34) synthetase TilS [Proteobacteria bacterium]|nr:tRNA lysidine(34) synthetase TilS [Pseudomonadota bacterium]